jgi:lysozyme
MATPGIGPAQAPTQTQGAQSLSQNGRAFIVLREGGFVNHNYNDNAHPPNCTYGAGTLKHHGPCTPAELAAPNYSQAQMEEPLSQRLAVAERAVRHNVTVPLTQSQFDALVSITYNAGPGTRGDPTSGAQPLYRAINSQGPEAAAQTILSTAIHSRHRDPRTHRVTRTVNHGVVNRRHFELQLYRGQL